MSRYHFFNLINTMFSYCVTKIFFNKARLIRMPIYIRGKKGISYQSGLTTGHSCRLDASDSHISLVIGENARIGDNVHINACKEVVIGKNVLMASKIFISDTSHGAYKGNLQSKPNSNPSERELVYDSVHIGDNVWIGENAVILPGAKIGNGCIIGANTLVLAGVYQDNSIIVGSPGKVIKSFDIEENRWKLVRNTEDRQ